MTIMVRAIVLAMLILFPALANAKGSIIGVSWANLSTAETKTAAAALRKTLESNGDKYLFEIALNSASKQVEDIEKLLKDGVQVLIIDAVDPTQIQPALLLASDHRVPVIAFRQMLYDPDVLNIVPDYKQIGKLQAQAITDQQPEGNYVFAKGPEADVASGLIFEGQHEVLSSDLASGKIVNTGEFRTKKHSADSAEKNIISILTKNNNHIDAVLAVNDEMAEGVIAGLQQEGLAGMVPVSGSGGTRAALNRVALGIQAMTFWQDPRELGKKAGLAASLLARGQSQDISGIKIETNPATGEKYSAIFLPPTEITKDNLEVVIDAGWVSKAEVCADTSPGSSSACPLQMKGGTPDSSVRSVPIYFGTDRSDRLGSVPIDFTAARSDHLTVGVAHVSIPDDHRFGITERPSTLRFLWITLTRGTVDPHEFFTVQDAKILNMEEFADEASAQVEAGRRYPKQAFIFVHGFNVGFDDALYSVAQIVWDIQFDGLACLYSWPSKGSLADYVYDSNSALQARIELAKFLDLVQSIDGVESVNLIAHSMGSVALIEALREHAKEAHAKPFDGLIFAAPDIDKDNFISLAQKLRSYASGVTLYASANDRALQLSETFASNIARAGEVPDSGPIVIPNMDTIDASAVSNYLFGLNHSYFAQDRSVVSDIGMLLQRGTRPPSARNPTIKAITNRSGQTYWRFPR